MNERTVRHSFAKRFSAAMRARDLTAAAIVENSPVKLSFANINSWKAGKCLPKAYRMIVLAQMLGVSVDWLLGGGDDER